MERPFDLVAGPLWRVTLMKLAAEEHILLLCMHHINIDDVSLGLLFRELRLLYAAFIADKPSPLPPLPAQYIDYAQWQRQHLTPSLLAARLEYWRQWLAEEPPPLTLPTDHPRPDQPSFHAGTVWFQIPPELTQALKNLSQQANSTLFMTVLTALASLLYRYSGQETIVVGAPAIRREQWQFEPIIGRIGGMLALRIDLSGNATFRELLQRVQQAVLTAITHQDVPFEQFAKTLQPERKHKNPLFRVLISYLTESPRAQLKLPGLAVTLIEKETVLMRPDLGLIIWEEKTVAGPSLQGWWQYKKDLFAAETLSQMAQDFQQVLAALATDPSQSIRSSKS